MKSIGYFEVHGSYVKPTTEKGSALVCPFGETLYDDFGNATYATCDSACPHFGDLERHNGTYSVRLTCGSGEAALKTKKVKVYK